MHDKLANQRPLIIVLAVPEEALPWVQNPKFLNHSPTDTTPQLLWKSKPRSFLLYHFFEEKVSFSCIRPQCKKNNVQCPFKAEPCYVENCRESPLFTRSLNIVTFRLVVKTSPQELTFCSIFEPLCLGNQIFGYRTSPKRLISLKQQCLTSKQGDFL